MPATQPRPLAVADSQFATIMKAAEPVRRSAFPVVRRHRPRVASIDPLEFGAHLDCPVLSWFLILTKSPTQSGGLRGGDRVLSGYSRVPIDRRRPELRVSTNSASGHRVVPGIASRRYAEPCQRPLNRTHH
jgi:hypothetical protein